MTNSTKIISESEQRELFSQAASFFMESVRNFTLPCVTVALPGGRSVVGFLKAIGRIRDKLPLSEWARLHFFMVDERLVDLEDPDCNFKVVSDNLLRSLFQDGYISAEQLHPFIVDRRKSDLGAAIYQELLEGHGGRFNISVLGVGEDGHIAALFPRHHSLADTGEYFIMMEDSPKPPPARMSASQSLIARSDLCVGLFIGEGKKEAWRKFNDPATQLEDCPAKLLCRARETLIVSDLV